MNNNELIISGAKTEQEARSIFFEWLSMRFFGNPSIALSQKQRDCITDLSIDFWDAVIQAFYTDREVVSQVISRIDQYYQESFSFDFED